MDGNDAFRKLFPGGILFQSSGALLGSANEFSAFGSAALLVPPLMACLYGKELRAYSSVTVYYFAARAVHVGLPALAERIRVATTPRVAKLLGSTEGVTLFIDENYKNDACVPGGLKARFHKAMLERDQVLRLQAVATVVREYTADFDRLGTLRAAMRLKFDRGRDPMLVVQLLATGDAKLGEARSGDDALWAVTPDGECGIFGEVLMMRRTELRRLPVPPPWSTCCDMCERGIANVADAGTCGRCLDGTYCSTDCLFAHVCDDS